MGSTGLFFIGTMDELYAFSLSRAALRMSGLKWAILLYSHGSFTTSYKQGASFVLQFHEALAGFSPQATTKGFPQLTVQFSDSKVFPTSESATEDSLPGPEEPGRGNQLAEAFLPCQWSLKLPTRMADSHPIGSILRRTSFLLLGRLPTRAAHWSTPSSGFSWDMS